MNDDRITEAMTALIEAVSALGFDRAKDAIRAYGDEADEDAQQWHETLIDAVGTAVSLAAHTAGEDGYDRWVAVSPEIGASLIWAWKSKSKPDAEFSGIVMRSVQSALAAE